MSGPAERMQGVSSRHQRRLSAEEEGNLHGARQSYLSSIICGKLIFESTDINTIAGRPRKPIIVLIGGASCRSAVHGRGGLRKMKIAGIGIDENVLSKSCNTGMSILAAVRSPGASIDLLQRKLVGIAHSNGPTRIIAVKEIIVPAIVFSIQLLEGQPDIIAGSNKKQDKFFVIAANISFSYISSRKKLPAGSYQ